jgi:hypothetical protein
VSKETGNNISQIQGQTREDFALVEWSQHVLSFSTFNPELNTVKFSGVSEVFFDLFDYNEQEFNRLISSEAFFSFTYHKNVFLINSSYYTLVSASFYDEEKLEQLLSFNVQLPSGNLIFKSEFIPKFDLYLVYAYPKTLENSLKKNFINFEVKFYLSQFLNTLSDGFYCHVGEENIMLIYVSENRLNFLNSFTYQAPEDVVYNILNVYQQLGLLSDKEAINLFGKVPIESALYELIYKYINEVNFLPLSAKLNYTENIKETPAHYFVHHYANFL